MTFNAKPVNYKEIAKMSNSIFLKNKFLFKSFAFEVQAKRYALVTDGRKKKIIETASLFK